MGGSSLFLKHSFNRRKPHFVADGAYAITSAGDVARHDDIVTFTVQLTTPEGEDA